MIEDHPSLQDKEKEVEDIFQISFSQAVQFDECARKWAYQRVDKIEQPINFFSYFGTKVHKRIEEALKFPLQFPVARQDELTRAALKYLKNYKPNKIEVEKALEGEIVDGVQVRGIADIVMEKDGKTIILDWKTKNKLPEYPTEQNLLQGNLYAHLSKADEFIIMYPQHDRAWNFTVNKDEAKEAYNWVLEIGQQIVASGAREVLGKKQRATKNKFCFFCPYNTKCHIDGGENSYQSGD